MAGFDCTNEGFLNVTVKRSGFDSEIILGKSLTFNKFSADQWLFTKVLKQIVVNGSDVHRQWTKAGRYTRLNTKL